MKKSTELPEHHVFQGFCTNRPQYRDGKHPKAVKVFTVNLESNYLIVQNVPAVNVVEELVNLFSLLGPIAETILLNDYPKIEKFTQVLLVKFKNIHDARIAKRKMDNFSFMGNVLHVFYAPEFETVDETREKLSRRRIDVANRLKLYEKQKVKLYSKGVSKQRKLIVKPYKANLQLVTTPTNVETVSMNSSTSKVDCACSSSMAIDQGQWHKSVQFNQKVDEKPRNTLNIETLLRNANRGRLDKRKHEKSTTLLDANFSSSSVIVKNYDHPRKRLKLIPHDLKK